FLALSGGGSDGAFGAGVLAGWTASGRRPEFDLVTGVSTGALTAPFAFLGPKYDEALKKVFTESDTKDIAIMQPVRGLLGGDSLASNVPLAKVVAFYVNDGFMQVAAAGAVYEEMHVDGGATREVFLVPTQFMAQKAMGGMGINPVRRAY